MSKQDFDFSSASAVILSRLIMAHLGFDPEWETSSQRHLATRLGPIDEKEALVGATYAADNDRKDPRLLRWSWRRDLGPWSSLCHSGDTIVTYNTSLSYS